MKQIVSLIGTFVVLLQLHSTTVTADSQTGWDKIASRILGNTEAMKDWGKKLEEVGKSAWEEANVEVPERWAELSPKIIELLDQAKTKFSEVIEERKKTSSIDWEDIQKEINELVTRIFLKLREIGQKIVDAASGTKQENDANVDEAIKEATSLIQTETVNTVNILDEAAQKKLTADGKESQKNE